MKRYLVFAGEDYYPDGGWYDFINSFDSLDEAIATAKQKKSKYGWAHIVDGTTGVEVTVSPAPSP